MSTPSKAFVTALTILFGSFGLFNSFGLAQGPRTGSGGGTARPVVEPTRTRKDAPARVETRYVVKTVTPSTGQLFVATDPPGAVILLEPLDPRNKDSRQAQVPVDRRDWVFNDLKPGEYRVAATKPEYQQKATNVVIKRNQTEHMTLDLKPILYSVTINTNVDAGELKYGNEGETLKSLEFKNKSISLQLPAGDYVAQISADGYGYEDAEQKFTVTTAKVVDLPLKRIVESTLTLAPTWTSAELKGWEIPFGWQVDAKQMLLVKGRGVALPREARNRYYKDFRLDSNVRMTNRVAVSFALRARDSRNYYLLQITGENSDEPNFVRLFTVKNDVEQRLLGIPISRSKAAAMAAGQFFNVLITVKGYEIAVDIVDSQTGAPYNLGVLTDPDHNFAIGAVGIVARGNEENLIERFVVCTGKCMESQ
jgi:hypothetical protein